MDPRSRESPDDADSNDTNDTSWVRHQVSPLLTANTANKLSLHLVVELVLVLTDERHVAPLSF